MSNDSSLRTVLITGCSSGIGHATAMLFAQKGWRVFATVRKSVDADKLLALKKDNIVPVLVDIADAASITALSIELHQQLSDGGLHLLVNNAAFSELCPLEYADNAHIHRHFDANVIGTMQMIRAFLPYIKQVQGCIVNISSGAGVLATPLMSVYSATKFAVEGLSDALRPELRQAGVKIVLVEPGFINTEIHDKLEDSNAGIQAILGEAGWQYYGKSISQNSEVSAKLRKTAPGPDAVARVIYRAATATRPQARYTAGSDAFLMKLLAPFLTDRLRDFMWRHILKL